MLLLLNVKVTSHGLRGFSRRGLTCGLSMLFDISSELINHALLRQLAGAFSK